MKKIFLSASVIVLCIHAQAQYVYDYLKAANNYYKKADYASAAAYYEKYLQPAQKSSNASFDPYTLRSGSSKTEKASAEKHEQAVYGAAESYRLLNNYSKAEPFFQQAAGFTDAKYALAKYEYAVTLRSLGKYSEAEKAFNDFLASYTTADAYTANAKKELQNLAFIQQQLNKKDLSLYKVNKEAALNTPGANYAPVWLDDNTLLFTSTRKDSTKKNEDFVNKVYQAVYTGETVSAVSQTAIPQATDMHQGVATLSPDGNHIYLTRWTISKEGKKTSAIYQSNKAEAGWSSPELMDKAIDAAGSNNQQPFVTADGQYLIFASDRAGGQGGFDLYAAPITGGTIGAVENMGSTINTAGDEQAPYYHAASKTFVFASNGRVGMGGFDLYQTQGTMGNWSAVKNLGYPVNSEKDDIYFVSKGTAKNMLASVLLSSDRSSECCLELFSLQKAMPLKKISGVVTNCEGNGPLAGVQVQITDPAAGNKVVYTQTTGADGSYSFTMPDYQPLTAVAATDGYKQGTLSFNAPADAEANDMSNPVICLAKIPVVGDKKTINHLYYALNKAIILDSSKPAMDELVTMLKEHPTMGLEINGHTDNTGTPEYNQKLSEARAKNVVTYLISKGIEPARLQSKGFADTVPVATNDTEEGRAQNRRVEFKVVKE